MAWARWGLLWVALGVALVSLATPLASETVRESGSISRARSRLMLLPLACAAVWLWLWRLTAQLKRGERVADWEPFAGAVAIFVLAFAGLAYSLFPTWSSTA